MHLSKDVEIIKTLINQKGEVKETELQKRGVKNPLNHMNILREEGYKITIRAAKHIHFNNLFDPNGHKDEGRKYICTYNPEGGAISSLPD
jgi:hypothetical protein